MDRKPSELGKVGSTRLTSQVRLRANHGSSSHYRTDMPGVYQCLDPNPHPR